MTPTTEQLKELVARLRTNIRFDGLLDEAADALQAWIAERNKAEPVARLIHVMLPDRNMVCARTFDEYSQEDSMSNPYRLGDEIPLYTTPPDIESLRADAERYRYLREIGGATWHIVDDPKKPIKATWKYYDAAIDAAIASAEGK